MLKMSVFTNFAYLGIFLKKNRYTKTNILYIKLFRENSSKHTCKLFSFHVSILLHGVIYLPPKKSVAKLTTSGNAEKTNINFQKDH